MANFWNTQSVEPYRQFRFLVSFEIQGQQAAEGSHAKKMHFYAMKVDKPMFKVGEYNHKFLNHQFNYPGRLAWDPVTITMVDISTKTAGAPVQVQLFKEYCTRAGYPTATGPIGEDAQSGKDGLSRASATGALGSITITQLVPTGAFEPAQNNLIATHKDGAEWVLKNCFLTDVKFGSLDYGGEDAVQIQMTVRYDHAEAS